MVVQTVKKPPAMQETQGQSLGWEDPLEKPSLPTPVFLPGEFHGQRSLVDCGEESDMIDQHFHFYFSLPSFWYSSSFPHYFPCDFLYKDPGLVLFLYHSSSPGTFFFLYRLLAGNSCGEGSRGMFQDNSAFCHDKGFCLCIYLHFTVPQPVDMVAVVYFLTMAYILL